MSRKRKSELESLSDDKKLETVTEKCHKERRWKHAPEAIDTWMEKSAV